MSDSAAPWTVAHKPPLSMEFSRQENWSELPCPPPVDLPNPGFEPMCPAFLNWQAGYLPQHQLGSPIKGHIVCDNRELI